jgi:hypothetical protein
MWLEEGTCYEKSKDGPIIEEMLTVFSSSGLETGWGENPNIYLLSYHITIT